MSKFSWRGAREVARIADNIWQCFQRAGIETEPRREKDGDVIIFEVSEDDFKRVKDKWPICQALANCTGVTVLDRGLDMRQKIRFQVTLRVISGNPTVRIKVEAERVKP